MDVRIVHDEVNIKLTQRRRRKCLLDVMLVLHELHLDLLHAGGASVGEHDIYMFNTKVRRPPSLTFIHAGFSRDRYFFGPPNSLFSIEYSAVNQPVIANCIADKRRVVVYLCWLHRS